MCTIKYHPFFKKEEMLSFAATWMEVENILSEINQTERQILHVLIYM
jgi:hypothetical protein